MDVVAVVVVGAGVDVLVVGGIEVVGTVVDVEAVVRSLVWV